VAGLRVIRPGMLTTVQDLGRWGHQADGVPVGGPMDVYSHRLANRLVANDDGAAALEITLIGPELEAAGDVVCAVAGAEFELSVGSRPVPSGRAFELAGGSRLRFGRRLAGVRASLAVRGGIDLPEVLGSRSTSIVSRMGPLGGRTLAAGDVLPAGRLPPSRMPGTTVYSLPLPRGGARLRALVGPHDRLFTTRAIDQFFSAPFTVTLQANRMGYHLEGPLLAQAGEDVLSDATPFGTVQVPRTGQPILLMADRQTTGGYPRIATVISADLPLAGQLAPGDWIRFAPCTRAEALDALQRQESRLSGRLEPSRASSPRLSP
jgi:antagonist of KipI